MYTLTVWDRVGIVAIGLGIVGLAVVVVVCMLGQGCWFNTLLLSEEERRRREKEKQSIYNSREPPILRLTPYTKSAHIHTHTQTNTNTSSPTATLDRAASPSHLQDQPQPKSPSVSPSHHQETTHTLFGSLSSKRDSTYSSMSEYSGRTSPTNSCRSSVGDSAGSGVGSPVGGEAQGHISFGIQYVSTSPEANAGKLVITVIEARNLTGREYLGNACDPYVKVVVWREKRRSLRRHNHHQSIPPPLHVFRTRTVRHTTDPTFNQSFVLEACKSDLKELVLRLVAMNSDKWASPTTVGEVTQPLRDIKNLATLTQRTTLNYFLVPPKLELGEVLFGLSYLPTAQRLSVSIIKAQNLKYDNVCTNIKHFSPYVRVLLISGSGRVVKKKKTTWRSNTTAPIWNETLIFDLAQSQVENMTFLLVVCTRPPLDPITATPSDASQQTGGEIEYEQTAPTKPLVVASGDLSVSPSHDQNQNKKQDRYLGKLALGCGVRGNEQRKHWMAIMAAPRKVVSQWYPLK
ncbi:hypothetical protein Pmani_000419 [Petrolisthes manimaculis]|uniref:C2 domain-containing protein n=1 Tax=Petrolisthes manimaculis TaxID=1843537 RepID=A0AAE1QM45_9EUCA|nr:hypothetical protein Pmani_000419 [Petrolisthes manimaculis]